MPSDPDIAAQEIEAVRALARASSVLERSSTELNLAHYRVLSAVASGEGRASHVAAKLALGRPAISAAVESLTQRGLLTRYEVDGDQRVAGLRLTREGERLLAEVETEMRERLRDLCRRTPDGDGLLEALVWLGRALDERRAERWAQRTPRLSGAGADAAPRAGG
ncbi:MAG TPA: MarR family winged helix-turn-helix transcriptional regulator [Solirubrobacteraceae bacterium]|nr:MarR family winged helix-turn-helix transcriptional regulator [Solirubrobacteraceae bacterium]